MWCWCWWQSRWKRCWWQARVRWCSRMLTIQVCSLAASWRPLSCSPIFLSVTQFLNVYIDMYKIVQCSYCNTCEYLTVSHLNTLFIHIHVNQNRFQDVLLCISMYLAPYIQLYIIRLYTILANDQYKSKAALCNGVPSLTAANILVSLRCQAKRSIKWTLWTDWMLT